MNKVFLLMGGNLGNREKFLADAAHLVQLFAGKITASSAYYETAAWGNTQQPAFLNQAIQIQTQLLPENLLKVLLNIEKKLGRRRKEKYGPRTVDIDILFYEDQIIDSASLTLPHPELHKRRFALYPLQEIAAHFIHPVFKKDITQLLRECPDKLEVKKINVVPGI